MQYHKEYNFFLNEFYIIQLGIFIDFNRGNIYVLFLLYVYTDFICFVSFNV